LAITNYQYVSEQRISQSSSYVTYRADLVNSGAARIAVTASVSSLVPSIQVVPGQGVLHFAPVPANGTVTSLNTFTILVDRTVAFDFADLQWTFLAPVANAGPNRTATVGSLVTLNGSGSSDVDGDPLTFAWTMVNRPLGSNVVLLAPTSMTPVF